MQAYVVALLILTVAAACDYYTKKIPNLIIVSGYGIAFTTMIVINGYYDFYIYLIRALWPILALFIFYFLKALGAGDIKLFSVISIFCPTEFLIRFIICSFIIGALYGLIRMIINRELSVKLINVANHVLECMNKKEVSHYTPTSESSYICFSICMLFGFLVNLGLEVIL